MREGQEGQNKPKKIWPLIGQYGSKGRSGLVGMQQKSNLEKKSKQSVKKVREGDSLLERTENGGKVG